MAIMRRNGIIYGLLAGAWLAMVGWQSVEHSRVKQAGRAALVNRARAISTSLGVVIRSQARFGSVVSQERLESALSELAKTGEPKTVALLNAAGDIVAAAGDQVALGHFDVDSGSELWSSNSVTLVNLVDLGTNVVQQGEGNHPIIILPRRDPNAVSTNDWRNPSRQWRRQTRTAESTNALGAEVSRAETAAPNSASEAREEDRTRGGADSNVAQPAPPASAGDRPPGRDGPRRPPFGRPPWMNEEEFKALIAKQGLHSMVMVMSTEGLRAASANDLWLRVIIGLLGAVAVSGLALAWRGIAQSSELQMRLLRASELNSHLKEMNIAAAGLAHETRNPLNIIRGLAQMISKRPDTSPEIQTKSRQITDEVDRVSAQLNEFINYSKPREVRRAPVALNVVISDVVRALDCDLEEKTIRLTVAGEELVVDADEQLLRQVIFNLLINAVQAADSGGQIQINTARSNSHGAILEICDNGPGVPAPLRKEIFKPYFTSHKTGTGLGLAVVQQIVLAHGWEIECLPNSPRGAIFRIAGLLIADRNG